MFLRSNFLHNCYFCTAIILVLVLLANGDVVNGDCNVHDFADKIFRGALNHRRVVIVIAALLFIVSVLCIPNVKLTTSFLIIFLKVQNLQFLCASWRKLLILPRPIQTLWSKDYL